MEPPLSRSVVVVFSSAGGSPPSMLGAGAGTPRADSCVREPSGATAVQVRHRLVPEVYDAQHGSQDHEEADDHGTGMLSHDICSTAHKLVTNV